MDGKIDLHTHSTFSDGTYPPAELVRYAKAKGLRAMAITDHDSVEGLEEARMQGEEIGVEIVSGIELSAEIPEGAMHLLGFLLEPDAPSLRSRLSLLQAARRERNPKMVKKLRELGFKITEEEVAAASGGGQIGRPHFARVLMKKGYVETITEAFEKILGEGKPAYVGKAQFSPEECVDLIHEAAGVAVLAHPNTLRLPEEKWGPLLERLVKAGLDGMEVYYSTHTPEETARYGRLAEKWNLVKTGGSDFHGQIKPDIDLGVGAGALQVPYSLLEDLRKRKADRARATDRGGDRHA